MDTSTVWFTTECSHSDVRFNSVNLLAHIVKHFPQGGHTVKFYCSHCEILFGPFSHCWYLWSNISKVWTHSVTHCVLRCGHTVTHSVDTQCSTLCSKVWWHCDSQSVYTIPQCESSGKSVHSRKQRWTQCGPQSVPQCVSTLWLTKCDCSVQPSVVIIECTQSIKCKKDNYAITHWNQCCYIFYQFWDILSQTQWFHFFLHSHCIYIPHILFNT